MERDDLARMLEEGLSQSEIASRVGKHQSTISYWCAKHRLTPAHRGDRMARGALSAQTLTELVERDLTIRQIAEEVERSPTTVRYWMGRYGLRTTDRARSARGRHATPLILDCPAHGPTRFIRRSDGSEACARCRSEAVSDWRRRAKRMLVAEAGGACVLCGYDRCMGALEFHHVDPSCKRFALGGRGLSRAIDDLRAEAAKCVLLCSNCHTEVETGIATVPAKISGRPAEHTGQCERSGVAQPAERTAVNR